MYYILTTKYANAPVFCIKEPALKVLAALAKVEEYYLIHHMDEHGFTTIVEILDYMEEEGTVLFEDYWFDIYGGDIAKSEEPVEATYTTEDIINAWGSIELEETCIFETFPWAESYPATAAKAPSFWKRLFSWCII